MTFDKFKLDERILDAISYMGIEKPTPIQELSIPEILNGKDILACAQTGTGKTAAFILPVLHKLIQKKSTGINALIIVPTRELAIQIDQQIQGISYFVKVESFAKLVGVSTNTIRLFMRDKRKLQVETWKKLDDFFTQREKNSIDKS